MDRDNRKSHLAPQLSPATQDFLRSNQEPEQPPVSYPDERPALQSTGSGYGDIPIAGSGMVSPGSQGIRSTRSPTPSRNGFGGQRTPGSAVHPGMGSRSGTSDSVPRSAGYESTSHAGSGHTFSIPVRPGPPGGPLPPPPRRQTPDRRQAPYGTPTNQSYDEDQYRR